MAFGQSSGPPATARQVSELLELLEVAGHSDFRDARGPMGFTQRQAGGKFTRDEADDFIEQLQTELYGDGPPDGSKPPDASRATPTLPKIVKRPTPTAAPKAKRSKPSPTLADVPAEDLAFELQRRGWVVLEP